MYLFFDTETTGLPKNYKAPMTDVDNFPRIIQLAWQVRDETGILISENKMLIKPNGWEVPRQKFWIDNGYSTEKNEAEGMEIERALDLFLEAYDASRVMVAHNMNFDYPVLGAEMIRAGKKTTGKKLERVCTMASTTNFLKLPGKYGYKFPKLEELYRFLFKEEFDAHDAGNDVTACARCYFELVNRGVMPAYNFG